ncbi:MAG: hypothetical protein AB2807_04690 [Candidatus Sedimenticola endophacoides]
MKFHQLPMGATFLFRGEVYTKAGPFSAVHQESGRDQVMLRAASVIPAEPTPHPGRASPGDTQVRAAVDAYHSACLAILGERDPAVEQALAQAREQLLRHLESIAHRQHRPD